MSAPIELLIDTHKFAIESIELNLTGETYYERFKDHLIPIMTRGLVEMTAVLSDSKRSRKLLEVWRDFYLLRVDDNRVGEARLFKKCVGKHIESDSSVPPTGCSAITASFYYKSYSRLSQ